MIDAAIETRQLPFVRFARTLNLDVDVEDDAIEMPLSDGQAAGQSSRLKSLAPAMYG